MLTGKRKKVVVGAEKEAMKVTGLAMLTSYSFQIRARNSMGYGPPKTFVVKTKGPAGELCHGGIVRVNCPVIPLAFYKEREKFKMHH